MSGRKQQWTTERRAAQAARMRARWASGEGKRATRLDVWDPPEDRVLREGAGRVPIRDLVEQVNAVSRWVRTPGAVQSRLHTLGLSWTVPYLSATKIRMLFRTSPNRVAAWIAEGKLEARRVGLGEQKSTWMITDDALRTFMRTYPYLYDWRRITVRRWRSEAEAIWRADPYLTARETAKYLDVGLPTAYRLCREGTLSYVLACRQTPTWLIRRSVVMAYLRRRAA